MDRQSKRALLVVIAMFAFMGFIVFLGKSSLNLEDGQYLNWFEGFAQSKWVIPIILTTFILGSFIGVPQWALMAGMVVAFGWKLGGTGAWISTMISASVNFWLARWIGVERVRKYGGDLTNKITKTIRRNGIAASFIVRFVPLGPFVLVNMAAGVSGMKYRYFLAGTGLGITPKIIIVGLIATGLVSDDQSSWIRMGVIGLAIFMIGVLFLLKRRMGPLIPKD